MPLLGAGWAGQKCTLPDSHITVFNFRSVEICILSITFLWIVFHICFTVCCGEVWIWVLVPPFAQPQVFMTSSLSWKISFEVLLHVYMTASHNLCWFVSCTFNLLSYHVSEGVVPGSHMVTGEDTGLTDIFIKPVWDFYFVTRNIIQVQLSIRRWWLMIIKVWTWSTNHTQSLTFKP